MREAKRIKLKYGACQTLKHIKYIILATSVALASWTLIDAFHKAHSHSIALLSSVEVEKKSENSGEEEDDFDRCDGPDLFTPGEYSTLHRMGEYASRDISLLDIPPEGLRGLLLQIS